MYNFLGRFVTTHAWKICATWLLVGVALTWAAPKWDSTAQDDDIRFLPAHCPSVRGYQLLERAFPEDVFASRLLFSVERSDRPLTETDSALIRKIVADLEHLRTHSPELHIGKIVSPADPLIGSRLTSGDKQCALIQVSLGTPYLALQTRQSVDRADAVVRRALAEIGPGAPRILATGPAGIGRDLTTASADSLEGTTLATIALVIIVLLFVYRAPLLALVPLVTIAVSVWVALELMALLTRLPGVHLVHVSKVFAIVILYGAGTDYCLFLISRYREELAQGHSCRKALRQGIIAVGGSLVASAGTVICGLGLMGFAEFAKVRCAGPAIALSLAIALAASLTLAPALLQLLGQHVFWPGRSRKPNPVVADEDEDFSGPVHDSESGFWEWISKKVVARPVTVWVAAVIVLLPLAILGMRVSPNYRAIGELHPSVDSVQGLAAIQRHFTPGETGPITVLLTAPYDWSSPRGRDVIDHLSRGFQKLDNVAEVRSLTQPLGAPLRPATVAVSPNKPLGGLLQSIQRDLAGGAAEVADRMARAHYLSKIQADNATKHVTRLDVVLKTDPFAASSQATLDLIQSWLQNELPESAWRFGGIQSECYGVTVNARDLAEITEADRVRVNSLVLLGIFAILLVLVRRPWMAAYLLITVLFSYYATLGATALIGTIVSGRPIGLVDWRVPFFLFTILVAVGEDYNILLVMRVLQEKKRYGPTEGIRRALAKTGGTITSCGLIMAGTFATLMLAGLGTLVQIGFALAFGVLIDTFVVRPFLVPAFILVVWRLQGQHRPKPVFRDLDRPGKRRAA